MNFWHIKFFFIACTIKQSSGSRQKRNKKENVLCITLLDELKIKYTWSSGNRADFSITQAHNLLTTCKWTNTPLTCWT